MEKLKTIRLLLLDVDGVLTGGEIIYTETTSESKVFNVKDGLGLRLLMEAGITVGLVTGRRSAALTRRCEDLGIGLIVDGVKDKAAALDRICAGTGISMQHVGFMGDDLPDLPIMHRCGVSIAVADAHPLVRRQADVVTEAAGGRGAVREICEKILIAQGLWESVLERFSQWSARDMQTGNAG
jgi:3-deoxy-D-manno-octulosonate 8-phosphate phosphatase (KDO 8-P phosphatase)